MKKTIIFLFFLFVLSGCTFNLQDIFNPNTDDSGEIDQEGPSANDQEASNQVSGMIHLLPRAVTLNDEALVLNIRSLYDALTALQKEAITNEVLLVLTNAETEIERLKGETEDSLALVNEVLSLINLLPTPVTLSYEATVLNIRVLYDKLNSTQTAMIESSVYNKLVAAEEQIALLKSQIPGDTSTAIIINHNSINLDAIPESYITAAKNSLKIAYGHTSHGSQITTGLAKLAAFKGSLYTCSSAMLKDTPFTGALDLGQPNRTAWINATRNYLNSNSDINVVMWSWCGQVSGSSVADINNYLNSMTALETEFPNVHFVYMTGHLDGTGIAGNLNQRNEQIRTYCIENNKILFDFADIESYNPDGEYFLDKGADDGCNYNSGTGSANWALQWQVANPGKWYDCSSAHSEPLNANMKAYAFWNLLARISGYEG